MEWFGMITAFFAMLAALFTAYATYKIVSTMNILHDRDREDDIRKQKIRNFCQLTGNRYTMAQKTDINEHLLSEQRFCEALNTCAVVFANSKDVMKALEEYHDELNSDNLYILCESIANDLHISLNKRMFIRPFYPKRLVNNQKSD